MVSSSSTQVVVSHPSPVSATALFAVLSDPRRHPDIDGSGMVRAANGTEPITGIGDIFRMQMHIAQVGDYETDNHVVEFEPDRRIAWMTSAAGGPPSGQHWDWQLSPLPDGGTTVTHIYDWSRVTSKRMLEQVSFPLVPAEQLAASVQRLIAIAAD